MLQRRSIVVLLVSWLTVLLHAAASAGPLEDAHAAFERGDYAAAAPLFRTLAERGDGDAQFFMSLMYQDGAGVKQDNGQALSWLRKSAEGGYPPAETLLGKFYEIGNLVPKDAPLSVKWLRAGAEHGDMAGQLFLGQAYDEGRGVAKNLTEAAKWLRRAANQGQPHAQLRLGDLYANGNGVPQDYVQAHKWYTLAAAGLTDDSDRAQRNVALYLISGVVKKMSPAQIAAAQKQAREWQPVPETRKGK